jgi:hypothetical protein
MNIPSIAGKLMALSALCRYATWSHWLLGSVDWVLLSSLVMGSLPGIFFGSHLSARVADKVLRPVLAAILVIVGVRMLRA